MELKKESQSGRILNILCGVLMLVGIILAFFYHLIGGALVGLSVGIYFSKPLHNYVLYMRKEFAEEGIFKLLMLLGIVLYLLLVATAFVIAVVVGIVIMTLVHINRKDSDVK